MAGFSLATGDAQTVKRWLQRTFAVEALSMVYLSRFIGTAPSSIIQKVTDLQKGKGDSLHYQLRMALRGYGKRGRATLKGHLESIVMHDDYISIDTLRHGVEIDGRMTLQRTEIDVIKENKDALKEWLAQVTEQEMFAQLCGRVGTQHYLLPADFTGHAGNTITAPDATHTMYGGDATSEATIESTDKATLAIIDRFRRDEAEISPRIRPANVNGKNYWVWVIHPRQLYDIRRDTGEGEFQKLMTALAQVDGKESPIFKGGEFLYNGVVVHAHENVSLFANTASVDCASSVILGAQAGVWANGNGGSGDTAMLQIEEDEDFKDKPQVAVTTMWGAKKTRFNSMDYGCMTVKTAAEQTAA